MLTALALVVAASVTAPKTLITAASGVRLRTTAAADGAEVARFPICTMLTEIEAPGAKVTINGQEGVWEHLQTTDGKQGWMFSTGLRPFDAPSADATYLALHAERAGKKDMPFVERADLYYCLARAAAASTDYQRAAALELARLTVLTQALKGIGVDGEKQPHKGFLTQNKDVVVYSEPAGEWFVQSKVIWDAEAKYHDTPTAEALAWLAAQTPEPGECEGFIGCYLALSRMSQGEYLKRHVTGAHAREALKQYAQYKVADLGDLEFDIEGIATQLAEALSIVRTAADGPERKAAEKSLVAMQKAVKKVAKQ